MDWRCVNQPLGYCKGEPEWERGPDENKEHFNRSKCKRDQTVCPKYLTMTQKYAGISAPPPNASHSTSRVETRKRTRKDK